MRSLAITLLAMTACADYSAEDPPPNYQAAWDAVYDVAARELPEFDADRCSAAWAATSTIELPQGQLLDYGCAANKVGCTLTTIIPISDEDWVSSHVVLLAANMSRRWRCETAVHEYLHIVSACSTADGDGEHRNPALWEHYASETNYPIELEAIARSVEACEAGL